MKLKNIYPLILVLLLFTACKQEKTRSEKLTESSSEENESEAIILSDKKYKQLELQAANIPQRFLKSIVKANGELEVPPQHEAIVTAVLGGNVESIKVIEGDRVKEMQTLAYLRHPDLIKLQAEYQERYHDFKMKEKNFQRQQSLYEEELAAGKNYEASLAAYQSAKGKLKGLKAQLKQLHLPVDRIKNGEIFEKVPVKSPIDGFIEKVKVKLSQYADPQTTLFKIVNTDHIHADLMVFEKDAHKVKEGQEMSFEVAAVPGKELKAKIYSVGKRLEEDIKAVHIHAEIINNDAALLPGMYIEGSVTVAGDTVLALAESAVVKDGNKSYIFNAQKINRGDSTVWKFEPIEVKTGRQSGGWLEIIPQEALSKKENIVQQNAYYLISEMKKDEASHAH